MTKICSTTTDEDKKVFGLSGAANFLDCDARTVRHYANSGRLPCTFDSSGKRLFKLADLAKLKRSKVIRRNPRYFPANDARNSPRWSS